MHIRWLQTFVIAAKYENYRLASEKLFIAQPTVTVHIQHLEEALGCKLFKKNGRNISLTESGKHFLPYAQQILDSYNGGLESLSNWQQGYERKLTIAVSPLIAASILSYVIKAFMKEHPHIEVGIQVAESNEISSLVYEQKADLGISRMSAIHPGLECKALYKDPIIAVSAHDGGDSETSPPIELKELLRNDVLLTHNHPLYWDDLISRIRMIEPAVRTMSVTQVNVTKRFIEEGIGFSFLPQSTVKRELLEGRILEVHAGMLELPVAYTYLIQKETTEEMERFITFINQYHFGS
ncbi:LysR family transcriptional regulator [Pseudalkalibacillus salsuginis]|uniref:LysR family transcriptional regulator n=1 Tax=Pseudalkalibacillus salsuginis TaxID=2910972 RepID=UPI001F2AB3FA|nr:LysR family transcriptional regulator [Pseudalkalibacillus salsuginis]MCF6409328.1 LysR family transcriptional regulator [Pseudalkalibacillus salsuginis]